MTTTAAGGGTANDAIVRIENGPDVVARARAKVEKQKAHLAGATTPEKQERQRAHLAGAQEALATALAEQKGPR